MDLDLLASTFRENFYWIENLGNHQFSEARITPLTSTTLDVLHADLDGDGRSEIITAGDGTGGMISVFAFENGRFSMHQEFADPHSELLHNGTFIDFDVDGDPDFVAVYPDETAGRIDNRRQGLGVVVFENIDGRLASQPHQLLQETYADSASWIGSGDVDGDGRRDLLASLGSVSSEGSSARLVWFRNLSGSFATPATVSTQQPWANKIETVDLDGDGDNDVVTERAWHENLGGGALFATHEADWRRGGFSVADIDQDTDPDIVSSPHENAVNWYEQRLIGDSNNDGLFDSSDLVSVFQAGKFEAFQTGDATFNEGDWNFDGVFDSSDLVFAFQSGHYHAHTEIAAAVEAVFAEFDRD